MRTYRDKEDLKSEIRQSFEKYISEFDTVPEALKDKRVPGVDRTPAENLAYQMDISRSTVQEIYENARSKIVACLVTGNRYTSPVETTASAEDRRQLTAAAAAGRREPTQKDPTKMRRRFHYENCSYL